jgi:endoglucanase Acf2
MKNQYEMSRVFFLLFVAFQAISLQSIGQKKSLPDWLAAEKRNDKLVYVNGVTIANDTDAEMPTRITVEHVSTESKKATFDTFSDRGNFEFFLRPNAIYHIAFEKEGYLTKMLEVVTDNIPDKDWKIGFVLELQVSMEISVEGFSEELQTSPYARCMYSSKTRRIEFDKAFSKESKSAWEKERLRCLKK